MNDEIKVERGLIVGEEAIRAHVAAIAKSSTLLGDPEREAFRKVLAQARTEAQRREQSGLSAQSGLYPEPEVPTVLAVRVTLPAGVNPPAGREREFGRHVVTSIYSAFENDVRKWLRLDDREVCVLIGGRDFMCVDVLIAIDTGRYDRIAMRLDVGQDDIAALVEFVLDSYMLPDYEEA